MSHPNKAEVLKRCLQENDLQGCIAMLNQATDDDLQNLQFLTVANDIQRALKDHKQALYYAELLLTEHPNKPVGYIRTSQENLCLGRKNVAQRTIEDGLNRFPEHQGILTVAHQVFLALEDVTSALVHAQALHTKHPSLPVGFIRAAQDLLQLDQPAKALDTIRDGLSHHPDHTHLLNIGINAARALHKTDQSLRFAQRLIHTSAEQPIGFIRAAQDLLKLNQPKASLHTIQDGLAHHPAHPQLLITGIHAARATEQTELSLKFARALIEADPDHPAGYREAAQALAELGQISESLELMEQLKQQHSEDQTYLESIRRHYRFLGDRAGSLEASKRLFEASSESPVEFISDLFALQRIQEALSLARAHNLVSANEASELLTALESPESQPRISPELRAAFNRLNLFSHLKNQNFNPTQITSTHGTNRPTIGVVHVGKCAGESVLESLRSCFPEETFRIVEYHIFDANGILREVIPQTTNNENIHWIILTRDPIARWVSAFNWDYHTYHLNQYFYCSKKISVQLAQHNNCLQLLRGISDGQEDAIQFSQIHHLTYGHMAMGQAWYLSADLIQQTVPARTSLIRTEQIESDFESSVRKITSQFGLPRLGRTQVVHKKVNYKARYRPETFKTLSNFNEQDLNSLKNHLLQDYRIHELLQQHLTD